MKRTNVRVLVQDIIERGPYRDRKNAMPLWGEKAIWELRSK